ncbi:MAG: hypothetical protein R6W68_09805 [Ignavibacteriaceae bacterium]
MNNEIKSLQKIVTKDFVDSSFKTLIPDNEFEKLEEFRQYLITKVREMYEHNYELLVNTLYRIDISEIKLSELFGGKHRNDIPEQLTDLIIERQLQKIRFRQQYKEGKI